MLGNLEFNRQKLREKMEHVDLTKKGMSANKHWIPAYLMLANNC